MKIYTDLQTEMRLTKKKPVKITPIVIGNTGLIAKKCVEDIAELDIELDVVSLQKIAAVEK